MFDQNGQLRDTYDILKDLAKAWPNLTRNQQAQFALAQAGANQTQNFTALMDNFQVAIDATATAMDSAGSAMKENAAYMESLEAKTTQLKATFQDFANNVIDKELVSSVLSLSNNALGALNTGAGVTITQWGLLTGALTGGLTIFAQVAKNLVATAKNGSTFVSAITRAGTAASGAAVGLGTLASTALPIAAILAGITIAGYKLYQSWKEANPSLEDAQSNLIEIETRLNELESIPWADRTTDINREIASLIQARDELENYIETLKIANAENLSEQFEAKYTTLTDKQQYGYGFAGMPAGYLDGLLTQSQAVKKAAEGFRALGYEVNEYNQVLNESTGLYQNVEDLLIVINEQYQDSIQTINGYARAYSNYAIKLDQGIALTANEKQAFVELQNQINSAIIDLQQLKETSGSLNEEQQSTLDRLTFLQSGFDSYNKALFDHAELLNEVVNGSNLTEAKAKSLLSLYPQLSQAIEVNNGVYSINKQKLVEIWTQSGITTQKLYELASAQVTVNNTPLDLSQQMLALQALAIQAGDTAAILQGVYNSDSLGEWIDSEMRAGKTQQEAINSFFSHYASLYKPEKIVGSETPATTQATKKLTDLALEEFKNLQKDKEHNRELDVISESQYYDELEQLIKDYKAKATAHMKEYGTDVDTINRNMYQYEEEIYKGRAKLAEEFTEQQKKAAEEAAEAQREAFEKQRQDFETAVNYVIKQIDKEISKLQDLRDETEQYYDNEIEALNDANDELERQIQYEELLNNLAQAKDKQLYVFQNGQFQYVQDVEAIASAQAELDAYERDKTLRKEVENLEALKDEALASIDEQIEGWEKYKEEWSNVVNQYQEEQDRLIAEQVLGIDLEQENWDKRLTNLSNFVNRYNSILKGLNSDVGGSGGSGGSRSGGKGYHFDYSKNPSGGWTKAEMKEGFTSPAKTAISVATGGSSSGVAIGGSKTSKHALGTLSAPGGLSLVGERGPELRVLNSGDGIVPADATRNLWNWAAYNPKDLMGIMGSDNIFHIGNIALPNVTNAKSFVNGLKQLAYQRAYKRA